VVLTVYTITDQLWKWGSCFIDDSKCEACVS